MTGIGRLTTDIAETPTVEVCATGVLGGLAISRYPGRQKPSVDVTRDQGRYRDRSGGCRGGPAGNVVTDVTRFLAEPSRDIPYRRGEGYRLLIKSAPRAPFRSSACPLR